MWLPSVAESTGVLLFSFISFYQCFFLEFSIIPVLSAKNAVINSKVFVSPIQKVHEEYQIQKYCFECIFSSVLGNLCGDRCNHISCISYSKQIFDCTVSLFILLSHFSTIIDKYVEVCTCDYSFAHDGTDAQRVNVHLFLHALIKQPYLITSFKKR